MKVAFIGLGVMGYPMAGHLSNAGHEVRVYNRTHSKALKWCENYMGKRSDTPSEAAKDAEAIFICVGNDDDVRSVINGDKGILSGAKEHAIIVDHSTTSAELAKEMFAACAKHKIDFLDAPVSGGQAGAQNGQLTVMLGGKTDAYKLVSPLLDSFSQKHQLMGPSGNGQLTKMVNQICIAGLVQGLSEAMHFAQQANLNTDDALEVISKGAAQSWQMENRAKTMVANKFDFGFAVDWMRKDLGIVLNEAGNNGASLPITAMVDQLSAHIQRNGGGRLDTSSLITLLDAKSK